MLHPEIPLRKPLCNQKNEKTLKMLRYQIGGYQLMMSMEKLIL